MMSETVVDPEEGGVSHDAALEVAQRLAVTVFIEASKAKPRDKPKFVTAAA